MEYKLNEYLDYLAYEEKYNYDSFEVEMVATGEINGMDSDGNYL